MASFMKVVNVNKKNGKKMDVAGKTRNRITSQEFVRCAVECNGDIRKMSDKVHLNQPAQAILGRYKNLLKKGVKLPPYTFVKLRNMVEFTPQLWAKIKTCWNENNGDVKIVAEKIGISAQTILYWVKKVDKECFQKNIEYIMQKHGVDRETAITLLEKQGGYVSVTCEKKQYPRGKKASQMDDSIVGELNSLIENELSEMEFHPEEISAEMAEKIEDIVNS